jgi:DNA (cytosine-5)-methyltransferase 1
LNYVELFCGIGGVRCGLEKSNQSSVEGQNGEGSSRLLKLKNSSFSRGDNDHAEQGRGKASAFHCVWANDNDKYACQIYRKHFGEKELVEGDIRAVDAGSIPDFELLTAGFPCQSFSLAGKRRGFEDTRGTLFYEIARIARVKRPRLLLLENVKGLLSNDEGRTFATILETLDELGYDVEWQVLNSKYFGVPQNRERVFIVGHSRRQPSKQIFPVGENGGLSEEKCDAPLPSLTANDWKGPSKQRASIILPVPLAFLNRNQRNFNGEAMTVDGRQSTGLQVDDKIRRLTPTECERLQDFPDGWTAKGLTKEGQEIETSDTQRYKLLGNAVTTNVIAYLGNRLRDSTHVAVEVSPGWHHQASDGINHGKMS